MGLKLGKLIQKTEIDYEQLRNKTIAVDFSNTIFQFLSNIRQRDGTPLMDSKGNVTSHLMGILTRSLHLMKEDIKLVYIFDGKPPELKLQEKTRRELIKQKAQLKYQEASEQKDEELMLRYSKQTTRINQDMISESKELIQALGIPIIQSPAESDAQGSYLAKTGDVWAFASSDHDCLLFECPRIITNLTTSERKKLPTGKTITIKPQLLELNKVLSDLDLNQDQLISLAILIGTDYNIGGVPGIGPKRALTLVKKYKTPEEVFKNTEHNFNWKKIFKIFKNMKIKKDYKLEWKPVNKDKILSLLVDKHDFSQERIEVLLNKLNPTKTNKQIKNTNLTKWF